MYAEFRFDSYLNHLLNFSFANKDDKGNCSVGLITCLTRKVHVGENPFLVDNAYFIELWERQASPKSPCQTYDYKRRVNRESSVNSFVVVPRSKS